MCDALLGGAWLGFGSALDTVSFPWVRYLTESPRPTSRCASQCAPFRDPPCPERIV